MTTVSVAPSVEAVTSLRDVARDEWNLLAGPDDFYQSHEWLSTVERDTTASTSYLLARIGGRLAGALPTYRVAFEGNDAYRPERFRVLLGAEGEHLLAGARRCYRGSVLLAPDLPAAAADEVAGALVRAAVDAAAGEGLGGVILPFLPTRTLERIGRSLPVTAAFDSAEVVVPGIARGLDRYLARLPGSRRQAARREIRKFAAAGWHTRVERLGECLADAARLVSNVELRHGRRTPDILLKRVFRRQVDAVDDRAVVLTCRNDAGALVACSIFYEWKGTLYCRAVGFDYARCASFEYFSLYLYLPIELAPQYGCERLQLGREATYAKVARGAVTSPLWTARLGVGAVDRRPGVKVIDPAAMQQYAEDLRVVAPQAFPAEAWRLPASAHREPERLVLHPVPAASAPASEQCHELTVEAR